MAITPKPLHGATGLCEKSGAKKASKIATRELQQADEDTIEYSTAGEGELVGFTTSTMESAGK